MGIYSEIFKRVGKAVKKGANKNTNTKNKKMKKIKLTPEQKERLKGVAKKAGQYITSGKAQTATSLLTRYSQGKPVVIQKQNVNKQDVPDTYQVFGYPVKKSHVWIGTGIAILGIGYAVTHKPARR